ncbi:MAG: ion transporter [Aureispira sp.]
MKLLQKVFLNDKVILALISVNALIIFLQGFPLTIFNNTAQQVFTAVDDVITFCFLLEILVKSRYFGWKEYLKSTWNKLDVLLILCSVPPLVARFFVDVGTADIGFLLVFRVLRIFKFFRFIKFFPQVEHIFRSVREAMRASFVVLVAFFVFVFIAAIFSCYLYRGIAPQYFSDPIVSYYSMFKVFTIEGWNTIPDEITMKMNVWQAFFTKFYFILSLVLGGLIGLSIVNSIFVDAMVSDNNDDLEGQVKSMQKDMQALNQKVDRLLELLDDDSKPSSS